MPDLLMEPAEATVYLQRVQACGVGFDSLDYGAQRRAATELGLNTSLVSSVLRGRYLDPDTLDKLEAWVLRELTGANGGDRWARKGGQDHADPAGRAGLVPGNGGGLDSPEAPLGSGPE